MSERISLHTDTPLGYALRRLLEGLDRTLDADRRIKVYIAGGMAVHLYTGARVTIDVDAEFGARILLPDDLVSEVHSAQGTGDLLYFDTNYNASFSLMHEDYQDDAIALDLDLVHLDVYVLSPVDLVVSKIARFAEIDREDICALVSSGLTNAEEIEARALDALSGFVGGRAMLEHNLADTLALARRMLDRQYRP